METIKQHSKGGAVVTQRWCRYDTEPKHTTRRVCVCICDMKTAHSTVGSGDKDTMMDIFVFKNSAAGQSGQTIFYHFIYFPSSKTVLRPW